MTILMDNNGDIPARERVQRLFNQNAELENRRRKAVQARIPSDPNAWQKMRENFQAILLEDHVFSEKHEIEYALWQLHYRRIEELRATFSAAMASVASNSSQNGKGQVRGGADRVTKIRSQFKAFLTEATGFYHDFMLKIRAKYGLPLGYLSGDSESQIPLSQDENKTIELKKGLISCHRCFIYLGDLARYKGLYGDSDSKALDFATASSYYMQATSLGPSSGNPHHQLAILASYSGDELVTVYRYFRSLAVESPFVTAKDNLIIAFEKEKIRQLFAASIMDCRWLEFLRILMEQDFTNRQSYSQLLGGSKSSPTKSVSVRTGRGRGKGDARLQTKDAQSEGSSTKDRACKISEILRSFNIRFVRLNGILFTRTSLETFAEVFSAVKTDFVELLSSEKDQEYKFATEASDCRLALVRLIAVLIFSIHNVNRETENQSYAEILQRSLLLENAFSATFELAGLIVEQCCLLNDPSASYLLSGIMVFTEWLACNQDIAVGSGLEEKQASARLFFWNHFVRFLNNTLSRGHMFLGDDDDETCFVNMTRYEEGEAANHHALPEDFELRGFLPLLPAQLFLDFSGKLSYGSDRNKERKARMERVLAAGKALANVVCLGNERLYFNSKLKKFVIGLEPQVSDDYVLTTSETPKLGDVEVENPILGQVNVDVVQPKPHLHVESDEEDEVIVFKPSMPEKQDDDLIPKERPSEILVDEANEAKVNLGHVGASFSAGLEAYLGQNAFHTSLRPPVSVVNTQYLQPFPPSTSMWSKQEALEDGMNDLNLFRNGSTIKSESKIIAGTLQPPALSVNFPLPANNVGIYDEVNESKVNSGYPASFSAGLEAYLGQNAFNTSLRPPVSVFTTQYLQPFPPSTCMWSKQGALENGMNDLNLLRNGPTTKPESQIFAGTLQPPALSVNFPLPANNFGTYSLPMPHKLVPSKYDSIMSQGAGNLSMMPSVTASGSKKNPVSRPIRQMGPPPGFGSVSSKAADVSVSAMSLKAENNGISQMDDYTWLDGYNLPAFNRDAALDSYVNTSGHAYHTDGKSTSSIGTVSFPFPGKQVMTSLPVMENLNGWPEHQLSDQLKVYHEQQEQLFKANQQPAVLNHQYQGRSLREGFL